MITFQGLQLRALLNATDAIGLDRNCLVSANVFTPVNYSSKTLRVCPCFLELIELVI